MDKSNICSAVVMSNFILIDYTSVHWPAKQFFNKVSFVEFVTKFIRRHLGFM